jgi:hypothetical protein
MTDQDEKEQRHKLMQEALEALRRTFAPGTKRLSASDEPAPVFVPFTDSREQ